MATELKRMKQLIGSTADWAANDIVPLSGEIALEIDGTDVKGKIGDGVQTYSQLPYLFAGPSVPLAGTEPGNPITGTLVFEDVGTVSWEIGQANLFNVNSLVMNGVSPFSAMYINVRDGADAFHTFSFTYDAKFLLPALPAGNNEVWAIQGMSFDGLQNTLTIYSLDQDTTLRTANPVVIHTSGTENFNFGIDGKVRTTGVIQAGDGDQVLVTKKYVDDLIAALP